MTVQASRRLKEVAATNPLAIIEKVVKGLGIKTKLIGKPPNLCVRSWESHCSRVLR
jgi:hypothetical protein